MVASSSSEVILRNSYGLVQGFGQLLLLLHQLGLRRTARVHRGQWQRWLCPVALTALTRRKLLRMRRKNAVPAERVSVPTGEYRVIFRYDAMQSLLQTFWGVFSAENAQQNLSLSRRGRGKMSRADVVTIVDDPLMKGGGDERVRRRGQRQPHEEGRRQRQADNPPARPQDGAQKAGRCIDRQCRARGRTHHGCADEPLNHIAAGEKSLMN